MIVNIYVETSIICPTLENNGLIIDCELLSMAKEQLAIRKEIRKDWGQMEPRLIELAHKLEDNGLIENKDDIWLKSRISNLSKHFDKQ